MAKINVKNTVVTIIKINNVDYISLTDIARTKNSEDANGVIANWLRNRNTIEYLGLWECLYNPYFKPLEFEGFKNEAGANAFTLSPQKWADTTNAIGIISKSGRYGGTFAHKDIAFKFASWVSVEFELYLIKEFQRLKEDEQKQLGWSAKRELAKINYHIHTSAISLNHDFHTINLITLIMPILLIIKILKIKVQTTNMENINAVLINESVPQFAFLLKNCVNLCDLRNLRSTDTASFVIWMLH